MLSLPNDGRYPALDLDPQQPRQKTLHALVWQLEALMAQNWSNLRASHIR
jgi:hypothetical protein